MNQARWIAIFTGAALLPAAVAQQQSFYVGANATGQLVLQRTINLLQTATQAGTRKSARIGGSDLAELQSAASETRDIQHARLQPPYGHYDTQRRALPPGVTRFKTIDAPFSLLVKTGASSFGFTGLTHGDQRNANNGNQFSIEPPSPSVAVGGGFILEGVNNAVQVYSTSGVPLLPTAVSSNQLFGLAPAIDRTTGLDGPFPTDMRVFYDADISRWFVIQWAALNDSLGNPLPQSTEWVAVSQTSDPTGAYGIYSIDTTDSANPACAFGGCVPDYPQIGADKYGFYISSNEFRISDPFFAFQDATIIAISKTSLAAGVATPTMFRFLIPNVGGPEFAIQPATTPPGASSFLASGGLEYLVSSQATGGSGLAVWAMYNTSSLSGTSPNLSLTRTIVPTLTYSSPNAATQRSGPLTLLPSVPTLDGSDCRILSASYVRARLYVTLAASVMDSTGTTVDGGAFVALSPTFHSGTLSASVLSQGYLATTGNHLLRPAWALNSQGLGAIAVTLTGPAYYPSAAYIPVDASSAFGVVQLGSIQIAAPGIFPEDGFSAEANGTARWGDDSSAVAAADGSIWLATEYIPSTRTPLANWGTFITQYQP